MTYPARVPAFDFEAAVWRYHGDAPWHFVTVPVEFADDIEAASEPKPFGSVPVRARLGSTTWDTSLFPDQASGSYLLPIKRSVRDAESIADGDLVVIELTWRGTGSDT